LGKDAPEKARGSSGCRETCTPSDPRPRLAAPRDLPAPCSGTHGRQVFSKWPGGRAGERAAGLWAGREAGAAQPFPEWAFLAYRQGG